MNNEHMNMFNSVASISFSGSHLFVDTQSKANNLVSCSDPCQPASCAAAGQPATSTCQPCCKCPHCSTTWLAAKRSDGHHVPSCLQVHICTVALLVYPFTGLVSSNEPLGMRQLRQLMHAVHPSGQSQQIDTLCCQPNSGHTW